MSARREGGRLLGRVALTTRVALVTGCGKRDGMGRAVARRLHADGATVVLVDRDSDALNDTLSAMDDSAWAVVAELMSKWPSASLSPSRICWAAISAIL